MDNIEIVKLPKVDLATLYSGEPILFFAGDKLLAQILSDSIYEKNQVEYIYHSTPFVLSSELDSLQKPFISYLTRQFPNKQFGNGATVRLCSVKEQANKLILEMQPATYFQYLVTGLAASENYAVQYEDSHNVPFLSLIEPGPYLTPLHSAKSANHVGVACMLLCEDHVLLSVRSQRSATNAGMLGLSASGVLANEGHNTSPFQHILTEVQEELGLGSNKIDESSQRLIGIAREFDRAGKPEMYFVIHSHLSLSQLQEAILNANAVDSWESVKKLWINLSEDLEPQIRGYKLQPSAHIGLLLLAKYTRNGASTPHYS